MFEIGSRDKDGYPIPIAHGARSDEYGESFTVWALFRRDDVEEELEEEFDCARAITGWFSVYRGPGAWFAQEPTVRVTRNRVLVKQFRALDI